MEITQNETHFVRNFAQQLSRRLTIRDISGSEHSDHRKPDRRDHRDDVQFPTIDPAMPARFGRVGFGIKRGVRKFSLLTMLLMPHAASGSQNGAIDSHRTSSGNP